jgi:hypothetical protein
MDGYIITIIDIKMQKNEAEARIQQDCYVWFHNTYPHLRGLLCYNLGNSPDKRTGAINRSLGLQAGRSDMVFYFRGRALMIEFKTPTGSQQPAQKHWQNRVEGQGFGYVMVRSVEEFRRVIQEALAVC